MKYLKTQFISNKKFPVSRWSPPPFELAVRYHLPLAILHKLALTQQALFPYTVVDKFSLIYYAMVRCMAKG